jgi:hypothetical protein
MAIDRQVSQTLETIQNTLYGDMRQEKVDFYASLNIPLTKNGNNYESTVTEIDGHTLDLDGKRYLFAKQTNKAENGIYAILSIQPTVFMRTEDFQIYKTINNTNIQILEGSFVDRYFLSTTTEPFTLDTTNINIVESSANTENLVSKVLELEDYKTNGTIDGGTF